MSGWLEVLAADAAKNPQRKRSCILLWMTGGPTQMDTFDLKPGHANGGPFKEIATSVPGIKISEHLPKIAKYGDRMAIIRSMSTKEGDHGRATFYLRTGYLPQGPIQYPSLGSLRLEGTGQRRQRPCRTSSASPRNRFLSPGAYGPGFLGPQYAPLIVGDANGFVRQRQADYDQALKVQDLRPADGRQPRRRPTPASTCCTALENDFVSQPARRRAAEPPDRLRPGRPADAHRRGQGVQPRRGDGRGCATATAATCSARAACWPAGWSSAACRSSRSRLGGVTGVPSAGTRTQDNFNQVKTLSEVLDPAWATLMTDLKERGLLDTTLIVWMGEFGRTPKINAGQRPRPLPQRLEHGAGRRRHQGRPGHRQDQPRRHDGRRATRCRSPTSWPPSARPWASTRPSRTSPTSAGPSASPTKAAKPIKEVLGMNRLCHPVAGSWPWRCWPWPPLQVAAPAAAPAAAGQGPAATTCRRWSSSARRGRC